jgi:dUTP pyrophosphatase
MIMELKVTLDTGSFLPERAHRDDAGADLRTPMRTVVGGHSSAVIDTGVHIEIPSGYAGFLKSKSGLNVQASLLNEGVIDAGYTGSIVVKLYNHSDEDYIFEAGDKISQIVIEKVELPTFKEVKEFSAPAKKSARGSKGFGSTGK